MNSYERLQNRLTGRPVDRVPNLDIVMAFAARFIGETLARYHQDYHVLCAASLAMVEAFQVDVVSSISDSYREAADLGAEIEFPPDDLPVCRRPLLADETKLTGLKLPAAPGLRTADTVEAVRLLRARVEEDIPVQGWVEGALAQANVLRGQTALMYDLSDRPGWVEALLEFCCELEIAFARWQIQSGARLVGVGDAVASQLSATAYRKWALPYEQRIFRAIHEMGAPGRLHICGNTTHLLTDMAKTGADIVDIDWMVDVRRAAATLAPNQSVCGNFDPVQVMLLGTPDQVERAVVYCLENGGEKYLCAAGCEIPPGTPHDNLRAQANALSLWGAGRGR